MTMTEEDAALLRQALIKEGVGLLAVLAVVWYMGPGRILIGGLRRQAEIITERRDPHEGAVGAFRNSVSRWDHEQAAQQDRRAGRARGCGCGPDAPGRER
jgi:hypothetical protein